jgi:glycosyltransferase involved in cell wall biosynthesis
MSSKKDKVKVLVFIPLPLYAKWKGEGITQTVENIIADSSERVEYTLFISRHCLQEIDPKIKEKVKIITMGWNNNSIGTKSAKVLRVFYRLFFVLYLCIYTLTTVLLSCVSKNNYDVVYVPTPLLTKFAILQCKEVVTAFWDPFVLEFCGFSSWIKKLILTEVSFALYHSDAIITQSIVNKEFMIDYMHISTKKIFTIRNGVPDFHSLLPDNKIDKAYIFKKWGNYPMNKKSNILLEFYEFFFRVIKESTNKINLCVLHRLLSKDSDKEVKIITVSTQNRPYKQINLLFRVLDLLIKKNSHQFRFKLVFTCDISEKLLELYPWSYGLIHVIRRVTNEQLAIIYKLSSLVIHPSIAEGGAGTYPMFEAASLQVPSLSQMGRHMIELQEYNNIAIDDLTLDLLADEESCKKIMELLTNKEKIKRNINMINSMRIEWSNVRKEYENVFIKVAKGL